MAKKPMPMMKSHGGAKMTSGGKTATTPESRKKMIDSKISKMGKK